MPLTMMRRMIFMAAACTYIFLAYLNMNSARNSTTTTSNVSVAQLASVLLARQAAEPKMVVFRDSWMLEKSVDRPPPQTSAFVYGPLRSSFAHVAAQQLGVPMNPSFAKIGLTSDALRHDMCGSDLAQQIQKNTTEYGARDLVLIHVAGNDLQPCIVTSWFAWWSDVSQRKHARAYLQEVLRNIADSVQCLCGNPFRNFIIAEPPFSKYLPLAVLVSNASLRRLREEAQEMFAEELGPARWHGKPCNILVFNEIDELDAMGDDGLVDYVDLMHPGGAIHQRLGEKLAAKDVRSNFVGIPTATR